MKITIICGHFVPEMGYIEVHLANAFHQLGHAIKVITTNQTSFSSNKNTLVHDEILADYEVVRLQPYFSYGQIVRAKGIEKEIVNFNPDKVIVIGLGKIFPKNVFKIKNRNFELITLLGDNEDTYNNSNRSIKRTLLQKMLKTPVYELAIQQSDRLIGYTPSTKEIINTFINESFKVVLEKKYTSASLGFDEAEFYYSAEERKQLRAKFKIEEQTPVLITATRIVPAKKLEILIDAIDQLKQKDTRLKYVLIGFSDNEYSKQLKKYINDKQLDDVILTLPFMPRLEMVNYYNMADIGLWTQAAISIFEGLGTGLTLLLPNKKNVSHILSDEMGKYYSEKNLFITLEKTISEIKHNDTNRCKLAVNNKAAFSFKKIATNLIKSEV